MIYEKTSFTFIINNDIYKCELSYSNRTSIGYLSAGIYFSQTTNLIDRHKFSKEYNDEIYFESHGKGFRRINANRRNTGMKCIH